VGGDVLSSSRSQPHGSGPRADTRVPCRVIGIFRQHEEFRVRALGAVFPNPMNKKPPADQDLVKHPKGKKVLLRWLSYVKKHSRYLALGYAAMIVAMGIDVVLPKIFGFIVDRMLKPATITAGSVHLPFAGDMALRTAFFVMLGTLLCLVGIRAFLVYHRNIMIALVGERVHVDVRKALFDHLQRLPISYFDKSYTGRIMARLTTDTDALWHMLFNGSLNVVAPAVTIVIVSVILLRIHVGLALLTFAIIPIFVTLYYRARNKAKTVTQSRQDTLSEIYSRLQEQISGIRIVRIFGRGSDESEEFHHDLWNLLGKNMNLLRTYGKLSLSSEFATGAATAMVLCLGGLAVSMGQITVGELIQFYLYAGMLFSPLQMITNTSAQVFTAGEVAMERICELLDQPVAEEVRGMGKPCPRLKGGITVRDLHFAYEPDKPVFRGVSLDIAPGQTVALVGPSGVGKSTLVNLICRFYHYQQGVVEIDGLDIKDLEVESYRRQISYVAQDSFMFSGTIAENIKYAAPAATQVDVETVSKLANAHDFIMQMPLGYETELGERGVKLSGGQRQRINIARALIRKPSILIMDEPTSALDAESESVILEALQTVFKDLTCIIIAHRLSTVMSVDRIFVFSDGHLVQQGRHRDLVNEVGVYRELCRKQFVGFGGSDPLAREAAAANPEAAT
jgi:ABC-type multidrug transport system fused ATPase/permease subunit